MCLYDLTGEADKQLKVWPDGGAANPTYIQVMSKYTVYCRFKYILHKTTVKNIFEYLLHVNLIQKLWFTETSYLDVDFDVESFCLAVPIADVEAEGVLFGLSFALAVLDVEDAVRRQVLHRERHIRSHDPRAAN